MDKLNKTEKEIESMLDFEFEFEIDLFYVKRIKKWFKKKKDEILRRIGI
jgi:hypothetical protein